MQKKYLNSDSTPKYFFDKLVDITPGDIKNMGGRAIGIDIDNTICLDSAFTPFDGVKEWIKKMQDAGLPVMIITNTNKLRAKYFGRILGGIPWVGPARKPATWGFIEAAKTMNVPISSLVMIGDQLFTDIQGANVSGAISVRVRWTKREILLAIRYRLLRMREENYLKSKGLEDKI